LTGKFSQNFAKPIPPLAPSANRRWLSGWPHSRIQTFDPVAAISLYFDVHVPATVARQLEMRGVDILSAQADHRATLPDSTLLQRATDLGRTMVTSDIRFRALAEDWQAQQLAFGGLIYAHPLQVTIGRMVIDLELISKALSSEEMQNQVIYLPI
jgi:hypothetical protein